jgi:NAD(P)-dependent dehydrogenase (short-subunit alcohol dehydrogenase family)
MRPIELFSRTTLKGKISIVTGAGKGLGKEMALALAKAGSDLVLVARHQEEIDRTAEEIRNAGQRALPVRADVTRSDEISHMVERVHSEFGRIDVLVNNAGQNASFAQHKFEDIPEGEWISLIETNITGLFLVTQIVGKTMLDRGSGKIINIASSFGIRPVPENLCYGISKAAIIQMTKGLALEWAPRGVIVNCIAPGTFDKFPDSTDENLLKRKEERKKLIPLGRLGRLEELGPLLVYLASDASDFITGTTIIMDGGMVIG